MFIFLSCPWHNPLLEKVKDNILIWWVYIGKVFLLSQGARTLEWPNCVGSRPQHALGEYQLQNARKRTHESNSEQLDENRTPNPLGHPFILLNKKFQPKYHSNNTLFEEWALLIKMWCACGVLLKRKRQIIWNLLSNYMFPHCLLKMSCSRKGNKKKIIEVDLGN